MALRAGRVGVAPDQVDGQGKVIKAGGGGGTTTGLTRDTLFSADTGVTSITLEKPLTDYKMVLIELKHAAGGFNYWFSSCYAVDDKILTARLAVTSETFINSIDVVDSTHLTVGVAIGFLYSGVRIYGIK